MAEMKEKKTEALKEISAEQKASKSPSISLYEFLEEIKVYGALRRAYLKHLEKHQTASYTLGVWKKLSRIG